VDRLSDELHDLSRRLDERPRAMPAPPMPTGFESGPDRDIEGMPRWASDAAEEEETGPEAATGELIEEAEPDFAEPEAAAETEAAAEPEGAEPEAAESAAGMEPGDWLPGDLPQGKPSVAAPAPPVPDLELEDLEPEPSPEVEEAKPGSEPEATLESEPEPEPEPEDLEGLDEVQEQPAEESAEPATDARKEMRDYLKGVRERLEAKPVEASSAGPVVLPGNGRKTGALLDYLAKLSEYLPEREKSRFQASDVRLSMELIRSRLAGGHGLARTIDERYHPPAATGPLTRPLLFDAFSYLRGLAGSHPDPAVGATLAERIEGVMVRIGRAG
jgi:hypothetical protein